MRSSSPLTPNRWNNACCKHSIGDLSPLRVSPQERKHQTSSAWRLPVRDPATELGFEITFLNRPSEVWQLTDIPAQALPSVPALKALPASRVKRVRVELDDEGAIAYPKTVITTKGRAYGFVWRW